MSASSFPKMETQSPVMVSAEKYPRPLVFLAARLSCLHGVGHLELKDTIQEWSQ